MANFCDFEFRVSGNKKAVKAFYESTPFLDWKEVESEDGTATKYEMCFKGNCKWSINYDVEDDSNGIKVDLAKHTMSQIESLGAEYVGYSVRAKSEIFSCEVKVHYWSSESEFDQFDHYKNGKCLKRRKIAFDNYEGEENFDWDSLEFIGHEGEYDESVDGEENDINFMRTLSMIPGVQVPSKKPKEKDSSYDKLVKFKETLDMLDSLKETVSLDAKYYELTYNDGQVAKGPNYTMAIPDNFIIGKKKGRDFVAYLPEVNETGKTIKDIEQALVAIYPGIVTQQNNKTEYIKSLEYYKAFSEYSYYIAKETMGVLYAGKEFVPVLCKYVSGGGTVDKNNTHYFYNINIYMNGESKMFRFDVKGARKATEDIVYKMVVRLLDGITPAEKPYEFVPANDERFLVEKAKKKDFDNWKENLDILNKELNIIFLMNTGPILKKRLEIGDIKKNQLKKECEKILKANVAKWSKHYEEVLDFIRRLSAINKGNKNLINYYDCAIELIDGNENLNITITDLDITIQEAICDKKSTLEKLLTPEIKELLEKQGRNTNPEELSKQRKIEKRKKEIEERKRAWAEQDKIEKEYNKQGKEYIEYLKNRFKETKKSLYRSFYSCYGGDLKSRMNSIATRFRRDIDKLIDSALEKVEELKKHVAEEILIKILDEIERIIAGANQEAEKGEVLPCLIYDRFYYWQNISIDRCSLLKREIKDTIKRRKEERAKQEKEDRDFEETIKYGVEIQDLPKHRIYVNACQLKRKAKTSAEYRKAQKEFDSIKGYLDSDKRQEQCSKKVAILKEVEKAQKELDVVNKKLKTVSKEFAECEEKIAMLEKKIETNTSNLTKKQDALDSDISNIEKKREKQLAEIDAEIENLRNQESNAMLLKDQKEAELSNTFFLAFGKKNRLREEIASLTDNLVLLSKSISDCEQKVLTVKKEAERKIKKLNADVSDLKRLVDNQSKSLAELKETFGKLSVQKEEAQISVNEKKSELDNLMK